MTTLDVRHELDLLEGDLRERVEALGLEQHVAELSVRGYTVVQNAAPLTFFDELRARIVGLVEENRRAAMDTDVLTGVFSDSVFMLLGQGRIFEQAVCNPVFVTLNEVILGKGFQLQVCGGTVKSEGPVGLPLHTDGSGMREPYPDKPFGLTSLWACDEWTEEGGSTIVIPGSFLRRRNPKDGEGIAETIPLECPKGSIMFWDAATWHGAGPRQIPGQRVGFHTPCTQNALRTLESYVDLPNEIVDRNPAVLGRMIGREDAYGKQTPTHIPFTELATMAGWRSAPRYQDSPGPSANRA